LKTKGKSEVKHVFFPSYSLAVWRIITMGIIQYNTAPTSSCISNTNCIVITLWLIISLERKQVVEQKNHSFKCTMHVWI
jgi:hypothetical protein